MVFTINGALAAVVRTGSGMLAAPLDPILARLADTTRQLGVRVEIGDEQGSAVWGVPLRHGGFAVNRAAAEIGLPWRLRVASADDGNVPQNTLDGDLGTRWSAHGDGQWIRYDLGGPATINRVDIAWYMGDTRVAYFDIEVSPDAASWTRVFSGQSSGQTLELERHEFAAASGRYVRIVGHGNSRNTWNSITEVDVYGPGASSSSTISLGAARQFAAIAKDATGKVLADRVITWASTAPAVASVNGGLVTGLAVGTATIAATSEGQSGAMGVTVANAPVASVTVSPASASLLVAATQPLSAVLRDSAGNLLTGRIVTWTSSAPLLASVSANGLLTALAPGSVTITATSEGRSGTATITVASTGGTGGAPQPGPTDSILFVDGFESGSLSLWQEIPANGRYSITTNAARVKAGTRALQALFTPTNGYGMITRWFMPGVDEVYVKFHVLFEEGFQNLRGDGNGMHFFVLTGNRIDDDRSSFGKAGIKPNGSDFFYAGLDPEYLQNDPTLRPFSYYTYWPDMACGSSCYGNVIRQPDPKTALLAAQWQEVVFHLKLLLDVEDRAHHLDHFLGQDSLEIGRGD